MRVTPAFGQEGALARATTTPSADWLAQLCGWVRRAPGDLGPLAWPVVLMPQRIGSAFTFPDDARIVYQRVRWTATLPAGPLDLAARATGVAPRAEGSDIAVVSSASTGGTSVAESEVVVHTGHAMGPWGVADTPPLPTVAAAERRLSFALSEHDVAAFAELTGVHEPIHEDAAHAWRLGLANTLVQEVTLLLIVLQVGGARGPGSIEMWFPGVVPVGSLLTLWESDRTWEVRLAGTRRPVAIGRLSESIGQMADAPHLLERDT
jgi:hypothetical protein